MKTFKLNTESWHYWLYDQGTTSSSNPQLTICNYPWVVGRGMLFVAFVATILFTVALFILEPYAVGVMTLITGQFFPGFIWNNTPEIFGTSIFIQVLGLMGYAGNKIRDKWIEWRAQVYWEKCEQLKVIGENPTPKQYTGFPKLCVESYRVFKDKTCAKLERHTPGED